MGGIANMLWNFREILVFSCPGYATSTCLTSQEPGYYHCVQLCDCWLEMNKVVHIRMPDVDMFLAFASALCLKNKPGATQQWLTQTCPVYSPNPTTDATTDRYDVFIGGGDCLFRTVASREAIGLTTPAVASWAGGLSFFFPAGPKRVSSTTLEWLTVRYVLRWEHPSWHIAKGYFFKLLLLSNSLGPNAV